LAGLHEKHAVGSWTCEHCWHGGRTG